MDAVRNLDIIRTLGVIGNMNTIKNMGVNNLAGIFGSSYFRTPPIST